MPENRRKTGRMQSGCIPPTPRWPCICLTTLLLEIPFIEVRMFARILDVIASLVWMLHSSSVPRPLSRASSTIKFGGLMKTNRGFLWESAFNCSSFTCLTPSISISSNTTEPFAVWSMTVCLLVSYKLPLNSACSMKLRSVIRHSNLSRET